jgi:hypothetical protein
VLFGHQFSRLSLSARSRIDSDMPIGRWPEIVREAAIDHDSLNCQIPTYNRPTN